MLTYYLTYIISDINYVILGNPQDTALIKSACDAHIILDNTFNKNIIFFFNIDVNIFFI